MNILVIGGGGREHCLAWKISQSSLVGNIYAVPGNAGLSEFSECFNIGISKSDFGTILKLVEDKKIDLTVVGPEAPLVGGIVDVFSERGYKIFGPTQKASMIEGSKVFAKKLLQKYDIPCPNGVIFEESQYEKAYGYIEGLSDKEFPIVVKADGLAQGKGVVIADDKRKATQAIEDCLIRKKFGDAGKKIIIEEFLDGFEVSIICLCDGINVIPMALAQDYKRVYDYDKGKNTGGMGSYSPVPMVDEDIFNKILNKIIFPTYHALIKEDIEYKGVFYGGLLIREKEPFLLEYNCRFGDPETQAILPRLEDDLVPLLMDSIDGKLSGKKLRWDSKKCLCVVLASKGYPESSSKGDTIEGLGKLKKDSDILIFHAGTRKEDKKIVTNGGRVLGVVSKADSFKEVRRKVYSAIENIYFDGMQYRKDIALRVEEIE